MPTALFREKSANRKLAPVKIVDGNGARPAFIPQAPYCSSTYTSIKATCPDSCSFKNNGCYAVAGYTGIVQAKLDEGARGKTAIDVIREEVNLIDNAFGGGKIPQDGARGGRDLRLHVGGDVGSHQGALLLAGAAGRWYARGGGAVWTYTHLWQSIERKAWGGISGLASVERAEDIGEANRKGYAAALVVPRFHTEKTFVLGKHKVVPCPAETSDVTCVQCRLCLDRDLLGLGLTIGFSAHGRDITAARSALTQLRLAL